MEGEKIRKEIAREIKKAEKFFRNREYGEFRRALERQGFAKMTAEELSRLLNICVEEAQKFLEHYLSDKEAKAGSFVFEVVGPMGLFRYRDTNYFILLQEYVNYVHGIRRLDYYIFSIDSLRHEFELFKKHDC
jgi:hypothetical protein